MTLSAATTIARRVIGRKRPQTMAQDLHELGLVEIDMSLRIRFPCERYYSDPIGFGHDILGLETWSETAARLGCSREVVDEIALRDAQVEVLQAIATEDRVSWVAGRRVSKSHTVGWAASWFYGTRPHARFIMSSSTARQVDAILWRQFAIMRAQSGRCVRCRLEDPRMIKIPRPCPHSAVIDGEMGGLARTGLKSDDGLFREVWGFTANEAEKVQGLAGPAMMFALDEASGIKNAIYDAIDGNMAGGAKILLTGNGTKTTGKFYNTQTKDKKDPSNPESVGWRCIATSSEHSPNVIAGRKIVDGLATAEWIEERKKEWGEHSPLYLIHVKGKFAAGEDGKIFSVDVITQAEQRHADTPEAGVLFLGVDPAGETGLGDESACTPRRGLKAELAIVERGMDADAHLAWLLKIISARVIGREIPVVVIDRSGSIGSKLYIKLSEHLHACERDRKRLPFTLVGVMPSAKAGRMPAVYETVRDELTANLEACVREGACFPADPKLSAELHTLEWERGPKGRFKVTSKDDIKRQIGRSPDRSDSLHLAFWEESSLIGTAQTSPPSFASPDDESEDEQRAEDWLDPFANV